MASTRVCQFCETPFKKAGSKAICPSCGRRQRSGKLATTATAPSQTKPAAVKTSVATRPTTTDWIIGVMGVAGLLMSIIGAFAGVLPLAFGGIGLLAAAFLSYRLHRVVKTDAPKERARRS